MRVGFYILTPLLRICNCANVANLLMNGNVKKLWEKRELFSRKMSVMVSLVMRCKCCKCFDECRQEGQNIVTVPHWNQTWKKKFHRINCFQIKISQTSVNHYLCHTGTRLGKHFLDFLAEMNHCTKSICFIPIFTNCILTVPVPH